MAKIKAKARLYDFDFSGEGAHMALVHKNQSGPANGIKTLLLKSVKELSDKQVESLKQIIKAANGFTDEEVEEYIQQNVIKNAGGDVPVGSIEENGNIANENIPETEKHMEHIEKSAVEALIQKALEEQRAEIEKAVAEKESVISDLKKSLEQYEAEKAEQKKAEFVAKAADYEMLGVEDKEAFGVALMKMSEQEDMAPVMAVLEKALNIAKQFNEMDQGTGHNLEPEEEQISGVMKAIQAKKSVK